MSAKDISRFIFQPEKRYASVRMQQGRVMLDSDWNESARIDDEESRRQTVETICAKGTSNQGFLVGPVENATVSIPAAPGDDSPATIETYDFPLASGSYYLGGLRFEVVPGIEERFLSQSDGLHMQIDPAAANLPVRPSVENLTDGNGNFTTRYDLVYLRAWEQCVTAVEDSELRERALGGPDTSVRIRRMRRVEVLPGTSSTCPDAFVLLKQQLTAEADGGSPHIFDEANCELKSGTRLTVSFDSGDITEDACKPKIAGGFLGAENQAIRVQLTAPDRFIWGYDNASPLYRVQLLVEDGKAVKIKFLTLPRDQAAHPLKDQAVEILPWSAILPNQEIVAELQGHLATVETGFNPEDSTLTISKSVPQSWVDWLSTAEDKQKYFYLRLWTGGTAKEDEPDWPFTPGGEAVSLKGTGLKVAFSSTGFPGDHWIIAARPNTPELVVPWDLLKKAPPVGTRFFFAPLAMIQWRVQPPENAGGNAIVAGSVFDCRHKFRPLCEIRGCCTVTVGDGKQSSGDVNSIQDAVDLLPQAGGEICVLDGMHIGNILIEGRQNIFIRGCGNRTVLQATDGLTDPIIHIRNCENIALHSVVMQATSGPAVLMEKGLLSRGRTGRATLEGITLENLEILARDSFAVACIDGNKILLRNNRIVHALLETSLSENSTIGRDPAVFLAGDDLRIVENWIEEAEVETRDSFHTALGGLQIGGNSNRVEIRGNRIHGGNGNGITLGSIDFAPPAVIQSEDLWVEFFRTERFRTIRLFPIEVLDTGCVYYNPLPPFLVDEAGDPLIPFSEGSLTNVDITDNQISGMGRSGISVAQFFDLAIDQNEKAMITVNHLTIEYNRIFDCMRLELGELPQPLHETAGFGGIALADGDKTLIRQNTIENNGTDHVDPICGIFMLRGGGLTVDNNRILNNGRRLWVDQTPPPGQRGGIIIANAEPLDGAPSARIHGNTVVSPSGRALQLQANGTVSVLGNQLTTTLPRQRQEFIISDTLFGEESGGSETFPRARAATAFMDETSLSSRTLTASMNALGGAVVFIYNLGKPRDPATKLVAPSSPPFVGGNILFNDNQVLLDGHDSGSTRVNSSVFLESCDDISMSGNQCDCDLQDGFVQRNVYVKGRSIRVVGNRFSEDYRAASLSAYTVAQMNSTVNNQSTHCIDTKIFASGDLNKSGNLSVIEIEEGADACSQPVG